MIIEEGKYYLYRWIRLDTNEPFYVGIGTKTEDDIKYHNHTRSKISKKNNPIWEYIKNKTSYDIEILLESNDYDFILNKEVEFIKLYGRINLGTGTLANLTDGGEGTKNVKVSEKARLLRRIFQKGKKRSEESIRKRTDTMRKNGYKVSEETKEKIRKTKAIPVLQFSLEGKLVKEWNSNRDASINTNIGRHLIANAANLKNLRSFTANNYIWVYKRDWDKKSLDKFNTALKRAKKGQIRKIILQQEKNIILERYSELEKNMLKKEKIEKLSKEYNMNYSTVRAIVYGLK